MSRIARLDSQVSSASISPFSIARITLAQSSRFTRANRDAEPVSRMTCATTQPSRSAHSRHSVICSSTERPCCRGSCDTRP